MEREERPEMSEECPSLENLLTSLNRDQLQSLVLTLAQRELSLVDVIKGEVRLLRSSSPGTGTMPSPPTPPPRVEVDPKGAIPLK